MTDGFGRASRRDIGSHNSNPNGFQGLWGGIVVDDLDPLKIGRVRVRIFDLHDDDVPVQDIPWALPCFPTAFANADDGHKSGGFFHIPPVDAMVHVLFQRGDPEFPVWMGGWFATAPCIIGREKYISNTQREALHKENRRPSCPTWRSLRGHVIEMDDEASEIRITSTGGHKITMSDDASNEHHDCIKFEDHEGNYIWMDTGAKALKIRWDGDVREDITGNRSTKIRGDCILDIDGDFSTTVGGKTTLKGDAPISHDAPMINLNCGSAQAVPGDPLNQGDPSAGDYVGSVLERLGNIIRKIVTGG